MALSVCSSRLISNLAISLDSPLLSHFTMFPLPLSLSLFPFREHCFSACPFLALLFALMPYSEIFLPHFLILLTFSSSPLFFLPLDFCSFSPFSPTSYPMCSLCILCSQAFLSLHCPGISLGHAPALLENLSLLGIA